MPNLIEDLSPDLLRQPHPRRFPDRLQAPRRTKPRTGSGPGCNHGRSWRKKAPPCDESGFLAAQVFAVAAETGWPEDRILFMPLARLTHYQQCLLRRNGVRTHWSMVVTVLGALRDSWRCCGYSGGQRVVLKGRKKPPWRNFNLAGSTGTVSGNHD